MPLAPHHRPWKAPVEPVVPVEPVEPVGRVGLIVFTLLWQCFKFVKRDVRFELVGKMQYYQIQSDILSIVLY